MSDCGLKNIINVIIDVIPTPPNAIADAITLIIYICCSKFTIYNLAVGSISIEVLGNDIKFLCVRVLGGIGDMYGN